MTWNYRIIRHKDGHLALHEVYYDQKGAPEGYTENPVSFVVDADEGAGDIVRSLKMALWDAGHRPVLDIAETWPDS